MTWSAFKQARIWTGFLSRSELFFLNTRRPIKILQLYRPTFEPAYFRLALTVDDIAPPTPKTR